jgi:transcriptional regulator with XRE-family HTH domain
MPDLASEAASRKAKPRLGERLQTLRRRRGWTLRDVGERSGLAISTLSKVERNQMSLTYERLLQLAEGLGVGIAELFAPDAPEPTVTARRAISRPGEGVLQETPNYDYRYLCTEIAHKRMVPILARVRARTIVEFGPLVRHAGEEFIYVLEGEVHVHTEHYDVVRLEAGGSIYLDSTMGHAYIAAEGEALVIAVCSSEEPDLARALQRLVSEHARERQTGE